MKAQRADILPAGIIVLDTVLDLIKRDAAVATAADLLLGFLLQQRDEHPLPAQFAPSKGKKKAGR
jgi:exopolyphosphatase/pppGpp-phosphohydrolase